MLIYSEEDLDRLERNYPGIKEQIMRFENADLPACKYCGSEDTADVQIGVIGRTITINGATTKIHLTLNGPKKGSYFCNQCKKYFDPEK